MTPTNQQLMPRDTTPPTRVFFQVFSGLFMPVMLAMVMVACTGQDQTPTPTPSTPVTTSSLQTKISITPVRTELPQLSATQRSEEAETVVMIPPIENPHISTTPTPIQLTVGPTLGPTPSSTPIAADPTRTPTLAPDAWQSMPVIPTLSDRAVLIYQHGLVLGNNPHAFSKIGDGEISGVWFFTVFDLGTQYYNLGIYTDLQEVISYFSGSFNHLSQAARRGFNTSLVLDSSMADPTFCTLGETPLACELRLNKPSFAIISMGTNQVWTPEVFATELRKIIDILIVRGTVPILATKGDNLEGDHRINQIIAELAYEYDMPLWNFWSAIQPLTNHGLQADNEHLTYARNDFSNLDYMLYAWPVRNLTALQVLQAMVEEVQTIP